MPEDKRDKIVEEVEKLSGAKIDKDKDIAEDTLGEGEVCELDDDAETDGVRQDETRVGRNNRRGKTFVARVKRRVRRPDGKEDDDYDIYTFDSEGKPTRRLMAK
jgi:hypothetical protein